MIKHNLVLLTVTLVTVSCSYVDALFDWNGKFALVTGGAQGNGYAIISELLQLGVGGVSLVDIHVRKGRRSAQTLNERYGTDRVIFVPANISHADQLESAFKVSIWHWNGLDIVINNAGVSNEDNWNLMIKVNVKATVHATFLGFEYMSKSKGGKGGVIINISSTFGINPEFYQPVYDATKSFILGLNRALGNEIYYDYNEIRIITVCPGATDTQFFHNFGNSASNSLSPFVKQLAINAMQAEEAQSTDNVAKGVISIIEEGDNGSVWVVEDNEEPYELDFPDIQSMQKENYS
ncbi:hypothetical protein RI129_010558 [Pyrocoelia pectoralis]|uniref:15-hydroxyprostaglandin dehydrogenase [NAD(+)]-like n=1 Tax=Pyrocoelia pectoralis TaxID=417401 RepID=A0AAN7V226_9COLE